MADAALERRELIAGARLFREGDEADCAYLVESGSFELSRKSAEGEVILATVGRGELIGEMGLIDAAPRSATARAVKASVVLIVPRDNFDSRLARLDAPMRRVLERFVKIIRNQNDDIVQGKKGTK